MSDSRKQDAIDNIRGGLKGISAGISDIRTNLNERQTKENTDDKPYTADGLHGIEKGVNDIMNGLKNLNADIDREGLRGGIADIQGGVRVLRDGLKETVQSKKTDRIKDAYEGLKTLQQGFNGLIDIFEGFSGVFK